MSVMEPVWPGAVKDVGPVPLRVEKAPALTTSIETPLVSEPEEAV